MDSQSKTPLEAEIFREPPRGWELASIIETMPNHPRDLKLRERQEHYERAYVEAYASLQRMTAITRDDLNVLIGPCDD